jgi:hypothetical protein
VGDAKHTRSQNDCNCAAAWLGKYANRLIGSPLDSRQQSSKTVEDRDHSIDFRVGMKLGLRGGQRLGCKFLLDDGSLLFVNESEITSEIESLMGTSDRQRLA